MAWQGNHEIGAGKMTLTELDPAKLARYRMDFEKPMQSTSTTDFIVMPENGQTKITWAMYGKNTLMGKVMNLFIDCDKMIGDKFEEGFVALKQAMETK